MPIMKKTIMEDISQNEHYYHTTNQKGMQKYHNVYYNLKDTLKHKKIVSQITDQEEFSMPFY